VDVRRDGRDGRDEGQVAPLLALVLVMALVGGLLVMRSGGAVIDRARARSAADAAALAGVVDGRDGAERLALDNDGVLEQFVAAAGEVEVTVRVGGARATSRARVTHGPRGCGLQRCP
jgi:hypothetical protein